MDRCIKFCRQNNHFVFFSFLALLLVLVAVFAPVIATHDPLEAILTDALKAPDSEHWFGTDTLGRDVFSRVIYGTRTSVSVTLALVAVIFTAGTLLGIIAGFSGGFPDGLIMRIADTMVAFPDLILAIAIAGILGADLINAMIAIAVVSWSKYARMARSLVLKMKNTDYMAAARLTGSKKRHLLLRYILPNILPSMIVTAANDIGTVLLSLASLSFLGFGIQPPTPEWGYMLSEGRNYFQSSPWLLLYPGIAIFIVVIVFNLLGDSLRDVLDPKED